MKFYSINDCVKNVKLDKTGVIKEIDHASGVVVVQDSMNETRCWFDDDIELIKKDVAML
jgi:hypothetical protein